jgi:intron-binding protein aquarius
MEEAGQILEMESFIPMVLQNSSNPNNHRLKRVVLLGDHYQLPPIIQCQSLVQCCSFDQSMFSRLIRSGFPFVPLNQQGRAKPEIASLYNWRYNSSAWTLAPTTTSASDPVFNFSALTKLGNLPFVEQSSEYLRGNTGFYYSYQFIHVPYYQNKGENSPAHNSFQNLGEAEYLVAVYQYMCLLGYPSEKISILTTYNGQRQLIKDILKKRCFSSSSSNSIFGKPKQITTVDKFQGQQNDFILLSLVRSESIGYLKDIRRLIVALSRAKFGLYIFGYWPLFEKEPSWFPILSRLSLHPTKMTLIAGESYPVSRVQDQKSHTETQDEELKKKILEINDLTMMGILVYQMTQQAQALQQSAKR